MLNLLKQKQMLLTLVTLNRWLSPLFCLFSQRRDTSLMRVIRCLLQPIMETCTIGSGQWRGTSTSTSTSTSTRTHLRHHDGAESRHPGRHLCRNSYPGNVFPRERTSHFASGKKNPGKTSLISPSSREFLFCREMLIPSATIVVRKIMEENGCDLGLGFVCRDGRYNGMNERVIWMRVTKWVEMLCQNTRLLTMSADGSPPFVNASRKARMTKA